MGSISNDDFLHLQRQVPSIFKKARSQLPCLLSGKTNNLEIVCNDINYQLYKSDKGELLVYFQQYILKTIPSRDVGKYLVTN